MINKYLFVLSAAMLAALYALPAGAVATYEASADIAAMVTITSPTGAPFVSSSSNAWFGPHVETGTGLHSESHSGGLTVNGSGWSGKESPFALHNQLTGSGFAGDGISGGTSTLRYLGKSWVELDFKGVPTDVDLSWAGSINTLLGTTMPGESSTAMTRAQLIWHEPVFNSVTELDIFDLTAFSSFGMSFTNSKTVTLSDHGFLELWLTVGGDAEAFYNEIPTGNGHQPVPEPGTFALLAAGLLGAVLLRSQLIRCG